MIAPVSLISILSGIMYLLTSGLKADLIQLNQICLTRPTFKSQLLVSAIDRDYGMHFHQSKHTKIPDLNWGMSNIFSLIYLWDIWRIKRYKKLERTQWLGESTRWRTTEFGGWKGDVEKGFHD